ncbi:MAG: nuclear transport factor 2 family protein [Leptolyngbya sp. SIOISBB]|nr:nuclear transport factor 2 family protein [Leptolyngbya sp. SIOISBB]
MSLVQAKSGAQLLAELRAHPTVERYFESFNAGDFDVTATLFAVNGQLQPPFEAAVVGSEAIAQYLKTEAAGMQAYPKALVVEPTADSTRRVVVKGHVKAIVFRVNAAWIFELNESGEIQSVSVKLLASMQELLSLRS